MGAAVLKTIPALQTIDGTPGCRGKEHRILASTGIAVGFEKNEAPVFNRNRFSFQNTQFSYNALYQ
eukprot:COSAG02_NODE_606_length_19624_cov_33.479846_10_plen_66_part_00